MKNKNLQENIFLDLYAQRYLNESLIKSLVYSNGANTDFYGTNNK